MAKLLVLPKVRHSPPINVEPIAPHIGKRLRLLRLTKGLSQAELGKIIGVSFQQIQKYERGLNHISAANLYHISQALHVPFTFFFGGLESSTNPFYNDEETDVAAIYNARMTGLLRALIAIKSNKRRNSILSSLKIILENAED